MNDPKRPSSGGYVEDDDGGTLAVTPGELHDARALPFQGTPFQVAAPPAPAAPPFTSPRAPGPPFVPAPAPPPPAPPPPQSWGQGQASAFVRPVAPPAPVAPLHREADLQRAAVRGATAASDAAADPLPSRAYDPAVGARVFEGSIPKRAGAKVAPRAAERVELLAFDSYDIEDAVAARHVKDAIATRDEDDEFIGKKDKKALTLEAKKRTWAARALAFAQPLVESELDAALAEVLDDAHGAPAYAVVSGDLTIALDPLEGLRILRGYASAWTGGPDKRLLDALEVTDAVLRMPVVPPEAVHIARGRIDDALRATGRPGVRELDPMLERQMLEHRAFARRHAFGARRILAHVEVGSSTIPAYFTDALVDALPLFRRFSSRLLVEIRGQQDAAETYPLALRVVAFGRTLQLQRAARDSKR